MNVTNRPTRTIYRVDFLLHKKNVNLNLFIPNLIIEKSIILTFYKISWFQVYGKVLKFYVFTRQNINFSKMKNLKNAKGKSMVSPILQLDHKWSLI